MGKDLNLSEKMKNLSDQPLAELKIALKQLKSKEYYDYESNSPYYRIFTSIYEKKEAIDFLLQKIFESKTFISLIYVFLWNIIRESCIEVNSSTFLFISSIFFL